MAIIRLKHQSVQLAWQAKMLIPMASLNKGDTLALVASRMSDMESRSASTAAFSRPVASTASKPAVSAVCARLPT